MRIAVDARSLTARVLRGWDRYTVGLVEALGRAGVEVDLLCRRRAPIRDEHVAHLSVRTIGLDDHGGLHWEQVALPRALRRYDVFHAPAEHGVPVHSPCPVVLTVHSVTRHSYQALVRRGLLPGPLASYVPDGGLLSRVCGGAYFRLQVARAAHVLTPSAFARDEVVRFLGVPASRVTVTPLAVSTEFTTPTRGLVREVGGVRRPYLLYVGGYEAHKNVAGLLQMFCAVSRRQPGMTLVVVGTGGVPETCVAAARALDLRVGEDVVFLHDLGPELPALYDGAALFVSMSWRESFGLPSLEAMTRGVPAVVSAWGASAEVVGDAGVLVDPRQPAAAAEAVLAALRPERREALSRRARTRASRFSWQTTADRTVAVYESLISTTGTRRAALAGSAS